MNDIKTWKQEQFEREWFGDNMEEIKDKIWYLKRENSELEAQIEKMKCCANCMYSVDGERGENGFCEMCGNKSEWELEQ